MRGLTAIRRIGRQGNRTALVLFSVTAVFMVMVAYSIIAPPVHTYREKQRFKHAAEQALPAGTVRTSSGVGGTGSYAGVASGHLQQSPQAVLAEARVPPGSYGWGPIPDCGAGLLCYLSKGKNFVLTLTVHPCIELGCPQGGTQVDAEVTRGGPNS